MTSAIYEKLIREREKLNSMPREPFSELLKQSRVVDELHVQYEKERRKKRGWSYCLQGSN